MGAEIMDIADINEWLSTEYKETCNCGNDIIVYTQRNSCPEYETEVYVKCQCGQVVEFILPVN